MIVHAEKANTAYRLQRTFKWPVYVLIQIRTQFLPNGNPLQPEFVLGNAQGEVQNGIQSLVDQTTPRDGILLSIATTSPPDGVPYATNWQGEFWYASTIDNTHFSILMGTETAQRL